MVGAACFGAYALFVFDPSVPVPGGQRVNNLGLLQHRQNLLIASCVVALIGCILAVFSGSQGTPFTDDVALASRRQPMDAATEKLMASEELRDAVKIDDAIAVRKVLDHRIVRPYDELPTGRGFLQYAVSMDALKCIPLLLQAGAAPDQRDSTGKTALDLAEQASTEVLALLSRRTRAPLTPSDQATAPAVAAQLEQLTSLHAQGILTSEEFMAAKGRVMA